MYSLSGGVKPLRPFDAWFGAHQRLDRFAIKHLEEIVGDRTMASFPTIKEILEFEGINGPDGIKIKTPAQGEPWHYYNPYDKEDTRIFEVIKGNYKNLVKALKEDNLTRAAFEAAWLAHAIVDGMTPAHHYPYEEELVRLRGGQSIETRTTYRGKLLMPGETVTERIKHNWEMMGHEGLLSTHLAFEFGVAVLIVPMRRGTREPLNEAELQLARSKDGYLKYFERKAMEVAELQLYEKFYQVGWTPKMVRLVRKKLVPAIVDVLALTWYAALTEAGK